MLFFQVKLLHNFYLVFYVPIILKVSPAYYILELNLSAKCESWEKKFFSINFTQPFDKDLQKTLIGHLENLFKVTGTYTKESQFLLLVIEFHTFWHGFQKKCFWNVPRSHFGRYRVSNVQTTVSKKCFQDVKVVFLVCFERLKDVLVTRSTFLSLFMYLFTFQVLFTLMTLDT